jgi:hypothetical protein
MRPTSTIGKGDASALLKVADSAIPVVTTAQFVVLSSRVRNSASVDFAAVEMGERADLCGTVLKFARRECSFARIRQGH